MTQTATKERPINFTQAELPMVRAILEGRKTQFRRVVEPQPISFTGHKYIVPDDSPKAWQDYDGPFTDFCPFGAPGDRLWVREAWQICHPDQLVKGEEEHVREWRLNRQLVTVYRATAFDQDPEHPEKGKSRWRSATQMPRHASRITLEVKRRWVERVQEISEDDAIAEGMILTAREPVVAGKLGPADDSAPMKPYATQPPQWSWHENATAEQSLHNAQMAFANLWDSINAAKGYGWASNPWVWCVEFERVER